MRILDQSGRELLAPDWRLGRVVPETLEYPPEPADCGRAEVFHYETVALYPEGREVRRVVDLPEIPPRSAATRREQILRFIPYTAEELAALPSDPMADIDSMLVAHELRLTLMELGL